MNECLLLPLLGLIAAAECFDARVLLRLDRRCTELERSAGRDCSLLRWYSQGFEAPGRWARWLVAASVTVLLLATVARAHPTMTSAALLLLGVSLVQLRYADARRRHYVRRAARRPAALAG